MSRTKKGSKPAGYEFWSKRHPKKAVGSGPYGKKLTHKYERNDSKKKVHKADLIDAKTEDLIIRSEIQHDDWEKDALRRYLEEIGPADND